MLSVKTKLFIMDLHKLYLILKNKLQDLKIIHKNKKNMSGDFL